MPMDITVTGGTPQGAAEGQDGADMVISPTFGAAHVSVKPDEYQFTGRIMGHYSAGAFTAAIAPTANTDMAAFRWGDATAFAVVKRVRVAVSVVTAVTAQAGPDVSLFVARTYTVRDATGATAVPITNDTAKMRQLMGVSLLASAAGGNYDVTSAAGGVTAGTKTLDASAMASIPLPVNVFTIGGGTPIVTLWDAALTSQHPLVLRQNEGILVRNVTAIATGTVRYYVAIDWLEASAY